MKAPLGHGGAREFFATILEMVSFDGRNAIRAFLVFCPPRGAPSGTAALIAMNSAGVTSLSPFCNHLVFVPKYGKIYYSQ
jgi:hypothetical protein